jgi:hypothetical protein
VEVQNESKDQAPHTLEQTIRGEIVEETFRREWLYIGLVDTDFKHWDDEEQYIRASGAVDALLELARRLGLVEKVADAEGEGRERLRRHMRDRQENGPTRLLELHKEMARIEAEVPRPLRYCDHTRVDERSSRGYYELNNEQLAIRDDLAVADLTFRYLDGEDISY